ncbi:MAG: GTP cyclohydrolase I [Ignavibacteria bacterium]|nr:GTP cyclohydrolase I [Ignavibacteria bacterium]
MKHHLNSQLSTSQNTYTDDNFDAAQFLQQNIDIPIYPVINQSGSILFDANGNMPIPREERAQMVSQVEHKLSEIFEILRINRNDPNSTNSPHRIAKMWVNELLAGRYDPPPNCTVFPNRKKVDELVISKGITVMSMCSHHWQTISGTCSIGYMPNKHVLGLSKFTRIVDWFSRRGQIQEELGEQIADFLEDLLQPKALGVVIKSKHYCMIARGVQESDEKAEMITSVMRGKLGTCFNLRNEFLQLT